MTLNLDQMVDWGWIGVGPKQRVASKVDNIYEFIIEALNRGLKLCLKWGFLGLKTRFIAGVISLEKIAARRDNL